MKVFYKIINTTVPYPSTWYYEVSTDKNFGKNGWYCSDLIGVKDCLRAASSVQDDINYWLEGRDGYDYNVYGVEVAEVPLLETALHEAAGPWKLG